MEEVVCVGESSRFSYSVIIPHGKQSGRLLQCLDSIANQKIHPNLVVVVCNGSISKFDVTNSIRDDISAYKFKVLVEELRGVSNANVARNYGLGFVIGEWVVFLDSDDWFDVDWSKHMCQSAVQGNADFIYSSMLIHLKGGESEVAIAEDYRLSGTPHNYLLSYKPAQTSGYCVRVELALRIRWDEALLRHQDYDYFVRIVEAANGVFVNKIPVIHVDWIEQRKHRNFKYCFQVVIPWLDYVEPRIYVRHIFNLTKLAVRSQDWPAAYIGIKELFCFRYLKSGYDIRNK